MLPRLESLITPITLVSVLICVFEAYSDAQNTQLYFETLCSDLTPVIVANLHCLINVIRSATLLARTALKKSR